MKQGMTFYEMTVTFERVLMDIIGKDARLVFPNQEVDFSQSTDILAIQKVNPGQSYLAEKGTSEALSQMVGTCLVNLSVKRGQSLREAKNLAWRIIEEFRRQEIDCLNFGEPWMTDVGDTDDGRYSLLVNIPFSMYFNTDTEEKNG